VNLRVLPLALAAALLACSGGHSDSPPDGGGGGSSGGGSGGGSGGSSGGGTTTCPPSMPATGASCTSPGLTCEYGSDQDLSCDTYSKCNSDGTWLGSSSMVPQGCPTQQPGADGCPAAYAAVPVGNACSPSGLECGYSEGRCACTPQVSGPAKVGGASPTWVCEAPAAGCPEPRPRLGTSCAMDNQFCDYGSCTLPNGNALSCENGLWAVTPSACAD
jgi:hypothetical protein